MSEGSVTEGQGAGLLTRGPSQGGAGSTPAASVTADPKPRKRYRASRQEWEDMHKAFLGSPCRVCGKPGFDSLHHIVRRSQGGDDVLVNLGPVHGSGTWGCHGLLESRDPAALAAFRKNLHPANIAYVLYRKNQAWLDRAYPGAA